MFSKLLPNFSQSLEQFFLTVGQENFDNKIPFPYHEKKKNSNDLMIILFLPICTDGRFNELQQMSYSSHVFTKNKFQIFLKFSTNHNEFGN